MPLAAIQTKSVDYILKAKDIPKEIIHLLKYPESLRVEKAEDDELQTIFELLREHTGIDFSQYKRSTILRRIERRLEKHKDEEEIRVWVAACSTGEEAYSIAIIFDEFMDQASVQHLKIFATDIDEEAIHKARAGIYPELALSNLSQERIKKYFIQKGEEFEVKPRLTEKIIFSKHDLISNPPFINLDLISCRNMLIYFK